MKAVVAAFNQEKAQVGAFSVIVKTDGSFAALFTTVHSGTIVGTLCRFFSHYNEGHHAEHGYCACFSTCAWPSSEVS